MATVEGGDAARRGIARSIFIVGGATFGSIVIGLVRTKVFALLLGPAGIGLVGILTVILNMGSWIASLGTTTSGVRQLAATSDDPVATARAYRGLWTLTWPLALAGGLALWLFSDALAESATEGTVQPDAIAWLGLGVVATVLLGTQTTVLQGLRRIGDLARVKLYGALVGTVVSIVIIVAFGADGIVAALVAAPVLSALVALFYQRELPRIDWAGPRSELWTEWRLLIGLGLTVTVTAAIASVAQLLVRRIIVGELGLDAAGLFQAVWAISATNLGLILAAISADYLPRMSAVADDTTASRALFNDQLRVALLLSAPLLALLSAAAPLVLAILYSPDFMPAARVLQWQVAGDAVRLASWGLTLALLAKQDTIRYIISDSLIHLLFAGLVWLLLPRLGLEAAGAAYLGAHLAAGGILLVVLARWHGIRLSGENARALSALLGTMLALIALGRYAGDVAAGVGGLLAAAALGWHSLRALGRMDVKLVPARLLALVKR